MRNLEDKILRKIEQFDKILEGMRMDDRSSLYAKLVGQIEEICEVEISKRRAVK